VRRAGGNATWEGRATLHHHPDALRAHAASSCGRVTAPPLSFVTSTSVRSEHVVLPEYATTGDGLSTALWVLARIA
jgi:hypothetical protein